MPQPDHAPVFILAPARSYSTVSIAMLAQHPDLFGFPELSLFRTPDVGGMLAGHEGQTSLQAQLFRNHLTGVLRAVAYLHEGAQTADAIDRAERWLAERSDWPTIRLMDHLLDIIAPRTGIEKSPDSTSTDEALDACVDAYPNARLLHLTRHPVTTQRSMFEQARIWDGDGLGKMDRAALAWYLTHSRIAKKLASMPARQWLRVRAEDLLRNPGSTLRRVCEWLELPCDGGIVARMRHPEDWCFADSGPDGNLLGGDYKFMTDPALRQVPEPGPVVFDPAWGMDPELVEQMTQLARFLGY
ncbi:MAG TPA: sulfotransferase [Trebonia sp.]